MIWIMFCCGYWEGGSQVFYFEKIAMGVKCINWIFRSCGCLAGICRHIASGFLRDVLRKASGVSRTLPEYLSAPSRLMGPHKTGLGM